MQKQWPIFDDFGPRTPVIQEPFSKKRATFIVACVFILDRRSIIS